MKFRAPAVIATAALGLALAGGVTACSSGPATVASKYKCMQTVNGKPQQAYCVQDSNGTNYYIPYLLWQRMLISQPVSKYLPESYTGSTSHQPPEEDVPPAEHPAPPAEHAPVEEAPVHVSVDD